MLNVVKTRVKKRFTTTSEAEKDSEPHVDTKLHPNILSTQKRSLIEGYHTAIEKIF